MSLEKNMEYNIPSTDSDTCCLIPVYTKTKIESYKSNCVL